MSSVCFAPVAAATQHDSVSVDLSGLADRLGVPVIVTTLGCTLTYWLGKRANRSNQTRPLVIEQVVIPLMDALRNRSGNRFVVEQVMRAFETTYLDRRVVTQVTKYLQLCDEHVAAVHNLNRDVARAPQR